MKLSINKTIISILLISTSSQVQSFMVSYNPSISTNHRSSSSSKSTQLNALTAQDILKRARKAAGVEEEPEPEPIFNDQIMNDFQQSLLMLEKRVKAGPGSLSSDEVKDLDIMLNRIMKDMVNHDGVVSRSVATTTNTPAPAPVATAPPTQSIPVSSTTYNEHNDEEGEAYVGKGGLGLAKGTANTYIIDGMDEMSPEEYRAALQESISGRQSKRRSSGLVGNMSSNNYLNNI